MSDYSQKTSVKSAAAVNKPFRRDFLLPKALPEQAPSESDHTQHHLCNIHKTAPEASSSRFPPHLSFSVQAHTLADKSCTSAANL